MGEFHLLDGKKTAAVVKAEVRGEVEKLRAQGVSCRLTVLLAGNNPASEVYVRGKTKDCAECGIEGDVLRFPADVSQAELEAAVLRLNADASVSGILVQLPLPAGLDAAAVTGLIAPEKDVDGFTPTNLGRLLVGTDCFVPCTPAGCMRFLRDAGVPLRGARAVVVGRSTIVGKPMAALLSAADATVTLCHSKTRELAKICREADILVAAVGRPRFITADMVREGAAVLDVGINRGEDGHLCGDVDFDSVKHRAGWITPVPGGVGLMTRAMLLANTVRAARLANGL